MGFILTLILVFVIVWIFQGTKGVVYMKGLHSILRDEYGWSQSEIDIMWSNHFNELNNMKIKGSSTREIAEHINLYLSQYKSI